MTNKYRPDVLRIFLAIKHHFTAILAIISSFNSLFRYYPFKCQPCKMVKYTQNNSSAKAGELFDCD